MGAAASPALIPMPPIFAPTKWSTSMGSVAPSVAGFGTWHPSVATSSKRPGNTPVPLVLVGAVGVAAVSTRGRGGAHRGQFTRAGAVVALRAQQGRGATVSTTSSDSAQAGGGEAVEILLYDQRLYDKVEEYITKIGGKCQMQTLQAVFGKRCKQDWLSVRFDVTDETTTARKEQVLVRLRRTAEDEHAETDAIAKTVARRLVRNGGAADLHKTCLRYGITKKKLLAHGDGKLFKVSGGKLMLAGGFGSVAAVKQKTGKVSPLPGRYKEGNLFTSAGVAVDYDAAEKLRLRIEAFLTSEGDGTMPASAVYSALGLEPSPQLRRWFKRAGIRMMTNGHLRVDSRKLTYYRVRRALAVSRMVSEGGGEAPLEAVLSIVHRPPEFGMLENGRWRQGEQGSGPDKRGRQEEVPPQRRLPAAPPLVPLPTSPDAEATGGEADGPTAESTTNPEDFEYAEGTGRELATAQPPVWMPVWVRHYFDVTGSNVSFPDGPRPHQVKGWPAPASWGDEPRLLTFAEQEANLMKVEEEIRLRYGRAHVGVLTGCFEGVRQTWLKRFFDITTYGDVVPKSADRQVREAIAIARRIDAAAAVAAEVGADNGSTGTEDGTEAVASSSMYTVKDAFEDYGASRAWLRAHFLVEEETGALALDDDVERAWQPPEEIKPPNPFTYAKLAAPRGYIRKGNGRYLPRKYGHAAGGILY